MHNQNIILIGPMGSGKSTLGKLLAKKYHLEFSDCDREIEKIAGANIPLIFEYEGEEGFRKRESQVLKELCNKQNQLIATGGGAVLKDENQRIMHCKGIIIFLNTSVGIQFHRTQKDSNRPLLKDKDPKKKLKQLYKKRLPVYRELADITVDSDGNNPQSIIQQIDKKLSSIGFL